MTTKTDYVWQLKLKLSWLQQTKYLLRAASFIQLKKCKIFRTSSDNQVNKYVVKSS